MGREELKREDGLHAACAARTPVSTLQSSSQTASVLVTPLNPSIHTISNPHFNHCVLRISRISGALDRENERSVRTCNPLQLTNSHTQFSPHEQATARLLGSRAAMVDLDDLDVFDYAGLGAIIVGLLGCVCSWCHRLLLLPI
jgi:hypothetical protein